MNAFCDEKRFEDETVHQVKVKMIEELAQNNQDAIKAIWKDSGMNWGQQKALIRLLTDEQRFCQRSSNGLQEGH
jgi:hypothetical protein